MAIIANLPRALGLGSRKLFAGTGAIVGTGTIITGLRSIDPGSAQVTDQNAAITIPTNRSNISGIVGGTVSIVVVAAGATANTISAVSSTVGLLCTGY